MASFAMAHTSAQGQAGQPAQQQQNLQARLDDPLVSEDFRGEIRDMNDYFTLSAAFAAQRKDGHDIAPLSQDPDKNFPDNDPVKQKQLVGRLFEAMRNQIDIMDGTFKKDGNKQIIRDANGMPVKRETNIIRRTREETNIRLEMLAWGLMLGIRDSQLGALYALKFTLGGNFEFEDYDSFMDRYDAVLDSIKVSKKAVADLMEPSWLCRLANAPNHEVQRKNRNKEGNKKKQTLLEEANAKRKRSREEQEGHQEAGEDNHDAASHNHSDTPGAPAAPAIPARQATRKTASRNARKQPKRSASDTPRRAAANTQSATAPPSGQSSVRATPQGFTQEAAVAPQMTVNDFHPTTASGGMGQQGIEVNQADQFFGPLNAQTASVGASAHPSAQPQSTSVSLQGRPQALALHQSNYHHQSGHPQQSGYPQPSGYPRPSFSQGLADQAFTFNAPNLGHPLSPAYGNNFRFLPQESDFGPQSMPQTVSSPGIGRNLNNTPGHISTGPNTPFSSVPQTPWSAETPEFTSPHNFGAALDNQQFENAWRAQMSFWDDA